MKLRQAGRHCLDAFAAGWGKAAMELRTGITLIEAMSRDEFETKLRTVTTPEQRDGLRTAMLVAAAYGLTGDELTHAIETEVRREIRGQVANTHPLDPLDDNPYDLIPGEDY